MLDTVKWLKLGALRASSSCKPRLEKGELIEEVRRLEEDYYQIPLSGFYPVFGESTSVITVSMRQQNMPYRTSRDMKKLGESTRRKPTLTGTN